MEAISPALHKAPEPPRHFGSVRGLDHAEQMGLLADVRRHLVEALISAEGVGRSLAPGERREIMRRNLILALDSLACVEFSIEGSDAPAAK